MPLAVSPEDQEIFRSYLSGIDQPADVRLAALDNPVPAPDLGPDPRLADNRRYNRTPDQLQDAGAPAPAPVIAPSGDAFTRQALQAWPGAEMPPAAAPPPPSVPTGAAPAPPGAPVDDQAQPAQGGPTGAVDRYILAGGIGGPSHVVPEHEQRQGYQRDFTPHVDRTRLEDAYGAQGTAEGNLDLARAGQLSLEQDAAGRRHRSAAADLGEFQMRQQAAQEELAGREKDYQKLVADSKVDPNIWNRHDTGDMLLTAIGGLLMGLGGGADRFIDMIQQDREHAQEERDTKLQGAQAMLADFRQRVMSPEAAVGYENAVKARIVAEDLRGMAAQSGSVEAQSTAELNARKMETYAAEQEAAAKAREAGAIAEKVAVVPRHVAGGVGGLPGIVRRWRQVNPKATPEQEQQFLAQLNEGYLNVGTIKASKNDRAGVAQQKNTIERQIRLPSGQIVYGTSKERADKLQQQTLAISTLRSNLQRQKQLLGGTLAPGTAERAEYNNIAARNAVLYRDVEDLGAITEADQHLMQPITGEGGQELSAFTHQTLRSIQGSEQHIGSRERNAMLQVYKDPEASQPLVTETEDSLGGRPVE